MNFPVVVHYLAYQVESSSMSIMNFRQLLLSFSPSITYESLFIDNKHVMVQERRNLHVLTSMHVSLLRHLYVNAWQC